MESTPTVISLPTIKKERVVEEIRRIAQEDTSNVFFINHALMRMKEREITNRQALKVLRHGDLVDGPEWSTKNERGWKCKFKRITVSVQPPHLFF